MPLLDAKEVRAALLIDVDLGDDKFVKARKMDLSAMLLEGELPLPLLQAAQAFVSSRHLEAEPEKALDELDSDLVLATLRNHAVLVVMEPIVTPEDDHVAGHMPVRLFTLPQLLAIWNQTALLPKVGAAHAASFRAREGLDPADVIPAREGVRTATQFVDRPRPRPVRPARPVVDESREFRGA